MRKLAIDIVSDVVCPWCLIGTRRLELALASFPDVEAEITFHPFLLDPTTPIEGGDLRERLQKKYGVAPERMFVNVEAAARENGVPLDFSKVTRWSSTVGAHTLLRHALAKGTQRALSSALFDAYFLEGRDVGSPDELIAIASAHGFPPDEARALLDDETERQMTRREAAGMASQGISGVPFFILGHGKIAWSGAQPVDTMKKAIERALAGA